MDGGIQIKFTNYISTGQSTVVVLHIIDTNPDHILLYYNDCTYPEDNGCTYPEDNDCTYPEDNDCTYPEDNDCTYPEDNDCTSSPLHH